MLQGSGEIVVVGEAGDEGQALSLSTELQPDVVVVGVARVEAGVLDGLECMRLVHSACPTVKLLAVGDTEEALLSALDAGAQGYLLQRVDRQELVLTVQLVAAGLHVTCTSTYDRLTHRSLARQALHRKPSIDNIHLTNREREILALFSAGLTKQEMAKQLSISPRTIDFYRASLMQKLGSRNIVGLVRFALENNICLSTLDSPRPVR